MRLSVVVSAYNEEKKIAACLESVQSLADEIIVVNSSSTDDTIKIAKKYTSKIYTRPNNPMLNVNKNYGFSKAKGEWILSLDSDERVTPELAEEVRTKIQEPNSNIYGYWIPRKNIIFGKWIQNSIWWPDYQLRLVKKGRGKFPEKHVHEMMEVTGETERLSSPMLHENYSSISQYLYKLDTIYTENEVAQFLAHGKKIRWMDAIRFPAQDFIKTFFFQKGYKDGLHGLVLSMLQAFYAEIVFAKIWEKQRFEEYNSSSFLHETYKELVKIYHEIRYWYLSERIEETQNPLKRAALKAVRRRVNTKINKMRNNE